MTPLYSLLGVLALTGLPLFIVLSALAITGFIAEDINPAIYFAELMRISSNSTLIAIPLFTLAGYLLAESKAPDRLVRLSVVLLGWLPGGLAIVALVVMALFTAFTGASGVTIVAMGGLLLPTLLKGGYNERFSLGLLTSSGSIGLLFPPSLPIIIYGVVSETSIDKLFIGGMLPGILLVSAVSLFAMYQGWKIPRTAFSKSDILPAIKNAAWEIPLPIIVVGGIYGGIFTATEAAVVTASYLLLVECFIKRDIHPIRDLPNVLTKSSILIGGILLIIGSALALTNYFIYVDIPSQMLEWIQSVVTSRMQFLLMLNIFLLIVGCTMDIFSALVVVVPLILPLAKAYGVDPTHLGIIFLVNLEIGYSTPPVGLNLFLASFRFEKPILQLYRATVPFLIIQLIVLMLVTYVPELTLYPISLFSGQ